MNKLSKTFFIMLLLGAPVSVIPTTAATPAAKAVPVAKATPAAQDGVSFGYCSDNIQGTASDIDATPYWIAAAVQLKDEDLAQFDGCEITGFSIGFSKGRNKEITLFLTHDLQQEPFYTQYGRCRASQWNDIPATTPITIQKGQPLYIGYRHRVDNSDATPVGFDGQTAAPTPGAGWLSSSISENDLNSYWREMGSELGNACIRVTIRTKASETANCVPTGLTLPDLVKPGQEFTFTMAFNNSSLSEANDLEVEYQIGNDAAKSVSLTLKSALATGQNGQVSITTSTDQDGIGLPVWARIVKVNGQPNAMESRKVTGSLDCTDRYFQRKMLVEKVTGSYCQYCPRGIVGFDYMNKMHPRTFVGVAVQNYHPSEPLYCNAYLPWMQRFDGGGVPYCFVNRNRDLTTDPTKDNLAAAYKKVFTNKCDIGVTLSYTPGRDSYHFNVDAKVRSVIDRQNVNYGLSFIITEDFLGPYSQANYYNNSNDLPEFKGKGNPVSMIFDDVARSISSDFMGIKGSVPTTLVAGEEYTYSVENMMLTGVSVPKNASLIAVLMDMDTNQVLNVERVYMDPDRKFAEEPEEPEDPKDPEDPNDPEDPGAGIDQTVSHDRVFGDYGRICYAAEQGEAQVYTLSGSHAATIPAGCSAAMPAGVYVAKTAAGTFKVIVK